MSDLIKRLRVHQKKAQIGISGYGKELYDNVNEFCAEIYADTGLAADQLEEYKSQLSDIRKAALPDPHDERDISVEWLRAVINRNTPP